MSTIQVTADEARGAWERFVRAGIQPSPYKVAEALRSIGREVSVPTVRAWMRAGWQVEGETSTQAIVRTLREVAPILGQDAITAVGEIGTNIITAAAPGMPVAQISDDQRLSRCARAFVDMLYTLSVQVTVHGAEMLTKAPGDLAKVVEAVTAGQQVVPNVYDAAMMLRERVMKLDQQPQDTTPGTAIVPIENPLSAGLHALRRARNGH